MPIWESQKIAQIDKIRIAASFRLKVPARYRKGLRLKKSVKEKIRTALKNRPEMREVTYRKRINVHEADAAMLELLPNFRLFANTNYNSNDFLLNNHWLGWGGEGDLASVEGR